MVEEPGCMDDETAREEIVDRNGRWIAAGEESRMGGVDGRCGYRQKKRRADGKQPAGLVVVSRGLAD